MEMIPPAGFIGAASLGGGGGGWSDLGDKAGTQRKKKLFDLKAPKCCSTHCYPVSEIHSYHPYSEITPLVTSQRLHYFQNLTSRFHCLKGSAPHYDISLAHTYTPVRSLRSSNSGSLAVPKSTNTWGE